MKEIFTSYLNRRGINWTEEGFTRIRICRWVVHESQHERYDIKLEELYPTEDMIRNFDQFETREDWVTAYNAEILDQIDPQELYDALPDKCVLFCHEKTEDDGSVLCHRRLVADWLLEHCLVEVPEWLPPEKIEELETAARREAQLDTLLDF